MYSCTLFILVCLARVKTKSISEPNRDESAFFSEENSINVTEVPFAITASERKCEEKLCTENRETADQKCEKGFGLVPDKEAYCKACECRNDNNCTFTYGWLGLGGLEKKCLCEDGYEDKKGECIGTCKKNPCKNEGKCIVTGKDIECKCGGYFVGSRCEQRIANPCERTDKGGCEQICKFQNEEVTCSCQDGYILKDDKKACIENPCETADKGGCEQICIFENEKVTCSCKVGYMLNYDKKTCIALDQSTIEAIKTKPTTSDIFIKTVFETSTMDSTIKPSTEDATTVTEYPTEQPSDITGEIGSSTLSPIWTTLSPVIDPCFSNPCKHDGICKAEGKEFVCYCLSPFSGKYCEMDPCSNNPCQNGGTCFLDGASFRCVCSDPFIGKTCEASPCMWNPCKNGGICKLVNKSARCFCDNPYTGDLCEHVKGNGLSITMLAVMMALLIVILMLVSCILCQRIRGSKTSRVERNA